MRKRWWEGVQANSGTQITQLTFIPSSLWIYIEIYPIFSPFFIKIIQPNWIFSESEPTGLEWQRFRQNWAGTNTLVLASPPCCWCFLPHHLGSSKILLPFPQKMHLQVPFILPHCSVLPSLTLQCKNPSKCFINLLFQQWKTQLVRLHFLRYGFIGKTVNFGQTQSLCCVILL